MIVGDRVSGTDLSSVEGAWESGASSMSRRIDHASLGLNPAVSARPPRGQGVAPQPRVETSETEGMGHFGGSGPHSQLSLGWTSLVLRCANPSMGLQNSIISPIRSLRSIAAGFPGSQKGTGFEVSHDPWGGEQPCHCFVVSRAGNPSQNEQQK